MEIIKKAENKSEVVFGTRAIIESIKSGKEIDKLYMQKSISNELLSELQDICKEYKIPVLKVPVERLNRITRKNHQGAIAYISAIQYASLDNVISTAYEKGDAPLLLILDRVTDVRNFGAIARTAECAGVHGIVIPDKGSAAINSDAMKTSAGGLNFIPVCREHNLKTTIKYLKESGLQIVACTEKADHSFYESKLSTPCAIILGSEEDGISEEYLKLADQKVFIPMTGNIQSLNVSVSAGVVIYEALRQRTSEL
ncbi:MAG: 23S rRNA (guanosine(2251)-2'-O)-methyltransferase RlmB [Cyclobacteriaceae bacterium]|nr:23S rRNA (guanosine(2251)-2'-O)-methyltransferase RlmB [Cyclobacteriaceae bacterium]